MSVSKTPQNQAGRYHGLDFLRAFMMLLGVVLHVLIAYWEFPDPSEDLRSPDSVFKFMPYRNGDRGETVSFTLALIHFFRMPGFYLLAGFFGALLIDRRGARSYLWNRATRVLFPFIVAWFVVWPLTRMAFGMGHVMMYAEEGQATLGNALAQNPIWIHLPFVTEWPHDLMHLWFLHYLVMFYVVTIPFALLMERTAGPLRRRFQASCRAILIGDKRWLLLPALVGLTVLTTLLQETPGLHTTFRFTPNLTVFSTYFLFFLVGWVFYLHREVVPTLKPRAGLWAAAGFALMAFVVYPLGKNFNEAQGGAALLMSSEDVQLRLYWVLHSVAMWLTILGLLGLSERIFQHYNPTIRYVVDASYWVYLIHFPISVLLPVLFHHWDLDADYKMWVMISLVSIVCFASYHFLARNTFIGQTLNGRRYPRRLPWREERPPSTGAWEACHDRSS